MVSSGRNIESEIAQLRRRVREDIASGGVVRVAAQASGNTDVQVAHSFPRPPLREPRPWWRVSSSPTRLLSDLFEPTTAVGLLNRITTGKDRVRVLCAHRVVPGRQIAPSDVYAAAGFHLDERNTVPVVLRAVALRRGDERPVSELLAAVMLEHLLEIDRLMWSSLSAQQRSQAGASLPRPCVVADDKDVVIDPDATLLESWGMRDHGIPPHMTPTGRVLRYV